MEKLDNKSDYDKLKNIFISLGVDYREERYLEDPKKYLSLTSPGESDIACFEFDSDGEFIDTNRS